jgi:hypothetical protein
MRRLVRDACQARVVSQTNPSSASEAVHGTKLPEGVGRDYEALWAACHRVARRQGLSEGMARFVARVEVHDRQLADRGLAHYGAGDIESVF